MEQEQKSISKGFHPELISKWQDMESNYNERLKDLEVLLKFQMDRITTSKAMALDQIKSDFEVCYMSN